MYARAYHIASEYMYVWGMKLAVWWSDNLQEFARPGFGDLAVCLLTTDPVPKYQSLECNCQLNSFLGQYCQLYSMQLCDLLVSFPRPFLSFCARRGWARDQQSLLLNFPIPFAVYSVTIKRRWNLLVNVVKSVVNWTTQKPCTKQGYSMALLGDTK